MSMNKPIPLSAKSKQEAIELISNFAHQRASRIPEHYKDKVCFLIKARYGFITLLEKRISFNDPSKTTCLEVFQVRYINNSWNLYWKRASGKWCIYESERQVKTIDDCIREVEIDVFGCFWG